MVGIFHEIGAHKVFAVLAILSGCALDYTLMSNWDRMMLPALGWFGIALRVIWPAWTVHRWVFDLVPLLAVWSYFAFVGWLISRLHSIASRPMVLAFALFALLYKTLFFLNYTINHTGSRHLLAYWALRDAGSIVAILLGGRQLFRAHFDVAAYPSRSAAL